MWILKLHLDNNISNQVLFAHMMLDIFSELHFSEPFLFTDCEITGPNMIFN